MLGIWGALAVVVVVFFRKEAALRRAATAALVWTAIALVPYSFLTYSTQIPSRQTYLASAGASLLAALAFTRLARARTVSRPLLAAIVIAILVHNIGYLWTKKRTQYLERAEPTEELIRLARRTDGPIWVRCFPRAPLIAEEAVHLGAGRPTWSLIWSESEAAIRKPAAVFCYSKR